MKKKKQAQKDLLNDHIRYKRTCETQGSREFRLLVYS